MVFGARGGLAICRTNQIAAQLAPQLAASPSLAPEVDADEDQAAATQKHIARPAEEVAKRLNRVSSAAGAGICADAGSVDAGPRPLSRVRRDARHVRHG
jgi:hypothetical protein